MKKIILISAAAVLLAQLLLVCAFWIGMESILRKPLMENFPELADAYTDVAQKAIAHYSEHGEETYIIIGNGIITADGVEISLTESEKESLVKINSLSYTSYSYIRVSSEGVFFWRDETGEYGVVYSSDIEELKKNIEPQGRSVSKLSENWYEISVGGIL